MMCNRLHSTGDLLKYLVVFLFLTLASPVSAQEPIFEPDVIPVVTIELWPDYDRPETLVLLTAALPTSTPTPIQLRLPLPAEGTLNAVAFSEEGQLFNLNDYDRVGDELRLVSPTPGIRIEYYLPYDVDGALRTINFDWVAPYAIDQLNISMQEPSSSENFALDQTIEELVVTTNELRFHRLPPRVVAAGETVRISASYELPGGRLTAPGGSASAPLPAPESNSSLVQNLQANWPWAAVGLGFLAIAIFFGWQTWRERRRPSASARKPSRQTAVFCTSCGTKNSRGDNFCRKCGQKLKKTSDSRRQTSD